MRHYLTTFKNQNGARRGSPNLQTECVIANGMIQEEDIRYRFVVPFEGDVHTHTHIEDGLPVNNGVTASCVVVVLNAQMGSHDRRDTLVLGYDDELTSG
jgi:hypothetical protein